MVLPEPVDPSTREHSSSSIDPPVAATSIRPFWQNGVGTSHPPAQAATKRKKRKVEETGSQARLLGSNGATWNIGKAGEGTSVSGVSENGSTRGRGRKKEGEEAERKEMAKRAKQATAALKKVAMVNRERSRNGDEDVTSVEGQLEGITSPSPGKRKRGRPRKVQQPTSQPSPPRPALAVPANGHSSSPSDVSVPGHRITVDRPPHRTFSRTVSSAAKGASHDPINVESPPRVGPKKLIFASDNKPAHAFFQGATEVHSQPDVPVKEKTAKTHAFFDGSGIIRDTPGRISDGWGRGVKEDDLPTALWPGGGWPSHGSIAGPSRMRSGNLRRRRLRSTTHTVDDEEPEYWGNTMRRAVITSDMQPVKSKRVPPSSIPLFFQQHPASTAPSRKACGSNRDNWCERYRPVRAEEVLGNEVEATYLHDWLLAMQVGGGRNVVRKIKRPKKQLFEGWIVDDIGLFGDVDEDDDEDELPEPYEEPELPLGERPDQYPPLSTRLTNTILLTGPHGSGKSAAVYAAATELGWEVFEVYPGTSKRTGANLMSLVGDVGRNHMVVKGGTKDEADKKKGPIKSFFSKAEASVVPLPNSSQGSRAEPIEVERELSNGHVDDAGVRQSLILIDEADILFAEEQTFWPAVIALIAESRRPVIITCNDPQLVPRSLVALQAILHFRPPPSYLAIPYLEAIALREGLPYTAGVADLYERSVYRNPISLDQALPPNGHEAVPYFDLRHAISQMQLDRKAVPAISDPGDPVGRDLDGMQKRLNAFSYADAYVAPRPWAMLETSEVDRYEPCQDDELGVAALLKPEIDEFCLVLPAYDRANDISMELMRQPDERWSDHEDLQVTRINYIRTLLPILDPLIPLSSHLLPHPSLFMDYVPVIQEIVAADDALEAAEEAEVASGGNRVNRKTGRPRRIAAGLLGAEGYERYLDVNDEALEAVRASVLQYQH